jgi:hypothetical protein
MTNEQLQKLRELSSSSRELGTYWDKLEPGDRDRFLSAFVQEPASMSQLPPDVAEHVNRQIDYRPGAANVADFRSPPKASEAFFLLYYRRCERCPVH